MFNVYSFILTDSALVSLSKTRMEINFHRVEGGKEITENFDVRKSFNIKIVKTKDGTIIITLHTSILVKAKYNIKIT